MELIFLTCKDKRTKDQGKTESLIKKKAKKKREKKKLWNFLVVLNSRQKITEAFAEST